MKCLTMILLITIFLVSCQTQQQAPLMPEATVVASPIPTISETATAVSSPIPTITPTVTAQATNTSQVTAVSPTNALQLAQKGQELYEDAPLLGLGLALEAWSLIPPENGAVKDPIIKLIQEMAAQGRLLKLGDDVENVKPSPDGANFLVHRQNLLIELRRASSGKLIAAMTGVSWAEFSPNGTYFIAHHHPGTDVDLRRASDGEVLATFSSLPYTPQFNFSPDGAYLVVNYLEPREPSPPAVPGILYRIVDDLTIPLPATFRDINFSPEGNYFIVNYTELPGELRYANDDQVVTLNGKISAVDISPDGDSFVVVYADNASEMRRGSDGQVIQAFSGEVWDIFPGPDGAAFVISYIDKPGELRRTGNGQIITTLADKLVLVSFSPDGSYFMAAYFSDSGTPGELRRTADGQVVTPLDRPIYVDSFSSAFTLDGAFVAIDYIDAPGEWRRTSDFQLLASLSGDIDRLVFSPDGAYVGFAYVDAPGELRRVSDGQIIATFGCDICELVFSQDGAYLTVLYDSFAGSELWAIGDDVRLLAHYDRGQGFPFLGTQRLAVQYYNVYALRAFLLDLDWLRAMGGDPAALAPEELVNILCQGPMALGLLPKTDLLPYLAGRLSQACN